MKKIAAYLIGVSAALVFTSEASAIPSFARQTGMACFGCHAQHFPVLNSFGRAFKASGFTLMGAQAKVEGEHLSIPEALNASILFKFRYQKNALPSNAGAGTTAGTAKSDGQWQFGDEFSLFFGGRVAENVGYMLEGNLLGGQLAASFKVPFVYGVGDAKLSVIPFATDAHGPMFAYEQSSGGVLRSNRWSESRAETSAIQYLSTANANANGVATGLAFVAQNDFGFIDLTKFSPTFFPGGDAQARASTDFNNTYYRLAVTPTLGNWAIVAGIGGMNGSSYTPGNAADSVNQLGAVVAGAPVATEMETRKTFIDFQAQGEVGGKELGVYVQHAKAPAAPFSKQNAYNNNVCTAGGVCNPDRKATTIGVDYSVIPRTLSIGAAYRDADTGAAANVNGADAWTLTAVYDLYQNVALHVNYSKYSGSSITNAGNASAKNMLTLMLEGAW